MEEYRETSPLLKSEPVKETSKYEFIRTVAPFMVLQAAVGLCASLQATFYPIEAELKGATASQFGAVFGIIHLSLFMFGECQGSELIKVSLVFYSRADCRKIFAGVRCESHLPGWLSGGRLQFHILRPPPVGGQHHQLPRPLLHHQVPGRSEPQM